MESTHTPITVSLPGRPVAEKIAHELIATGADFTGITFGTMGTAMPFGDEVLHLFSYSTPGPDVLIEKKADRFLVQTRAALAWNEDEQQILLTFQFWSALEAAVYVFRFFNKLSVGEIKDMAAAELSAEEFDAAKRGAIHDAEGTGGSYNSFIEHHLLAMLFIHRADAIGDEEKDAIMEARAENSAEDRYEERRANPRVA